MEMQQIIEMLAEMKDDRIANQDLLTRMEAKIEADRTAYREAVN
jgi:hypothetical protein